MELQRHVPGDGVGRRAARPGDLQAACGASGPCGTSRAASTAARSRRGGCRGLGLALVPPTSSRGRPVRRGLAAALHRPPTSSSTTSRCTRARRPPRRTCADVRVRPAGQQHRPQERPLPARRRTAGSGASTTGCASPSDFKLRTVIWEFGGERVPDDVLQDVGRVADVRAAGGGDPPRRRRGGRAPAPGGDARGSREVPDRHEWPSLPVAARVNRGPCDADSVPNRRPRGPAGTEGGRSVRFGGRCGPRRWRCGRCGARR